MSEDALVALLIVVSALVFASLKFIIIIITAILYILSGLLSFVVRLAKVKRHATKGTVQAVQ